MTAQIPEMLTLSVFFWLYLSGMLVAALRFGWHMLFRLDHFDWHFSKVEIWMAYCAVILFWPFLIFWPRLWLDPSPCFRSRYGQAERAREEERLLVSPPPCGDLISYRQASWCDGETFGEFVFLANDVYENLALSLEQNPHLRKDHDGAIMNWLLQRDASIGAPTPVPEAWQRFEYIADELVREGRAEVRCLTCKESVPADSCTATNEGTGWGWRHHCLYCPAGHMLLTVRIVHIMRPRQR